MQQQHGRPIERHGAGMTNAAAKAHRLAILQETPDDFCVLNEVTHRAFIVHLEGK